MPTEAVSKLLLTLSAFPAVSAAEAQSSQGSLERTIPKFEARPADGQPRFAGPDAPSQAASRIDGTFVLSAVSIEGATVFSSAELAETFEPYLASRVGQAELDRIAAGITERYRRAGYLLSYATVPEQSVRSGIVRVRIVEGYVDDVRCEGGGRSATAVGAAVEQLRVERPLRTASLERALGLARDVHGAVVTDVRLSRSPDNPAQHRLTLVLGADRARSIAYFDNRGTIGGARVRSYTSLSLASLGVSGDQVQLDLFSIPSDDFRFLYGQLKASLPLNADGLRLSASASRGDQFQRLPGANQRGKSRQLIVDVAYPFAKSRAFSLVGHVSLGDWKSEEERAGAIIQRDRLQVARTWIEFAKVSGMRIDGRIGVSRGFDIGPGTETGDPLSSRPGAGAKFTKFNADVQLVTSLPNRLVLRLDGSAQYSTAPILAPEEFALGGSRIGRAFDFNELTGDHGFGAMLEISHRLGDTPGGPKGLEVFALLDGGGAFRMRSSPGFPDEQWLAGTGAGARFSAFGFLWTGELGVPIVRSDGNRGPRPFLSVSRVF